MYDISVFAERLIAERKKKKLTQSELAEKAKISAQTVSYYEKGTKRPTLENAIAIANALDISIEYLCGQDASKPEGLILTVAELANAIIELQNFCGKITTETYTETVSELVNGADYYDVHEETYEEKRTKVCLSFSDNHQLAMVKFFENRKKMLGLLHDCTLDETIYNSWLTGEMQKLKKIPAEDNTLPF